MTKLIIAVFDGLQPAQVSPELAPNIYGVAERGVFFENHHPVFPSVTRINAASMVTGVTPGLHGLAGNSFVARDYDATRVISALNTEMAWVTPVVANKPPAVKTDFLINERRFADWVSVSTRGSPSGRRDLQSIDVNILEPDACYQSKMANGA